MQQTLATHHRRPRGVTIVAAILAIHGILDIIAGAIILVGALALGHVIGAHGHSTTSTIVDAVGVALGGITIFVGLIKLICPVGLLLLKRWAYWLALIIEVFSLAKHGYELMHPHTHIVLIVAPMILAGVIILYLLIDPNVRAAFFDNTRR
jgi:uncharacterized membrane protein (DUF2068 family)